MSSLELGVAVSQRDAIKAVTPASLAQHPTADSGPKGRLRKPRAEPRECSWRESPIPPQTIERPFKRQAGAQVLALAPVGARLLSRRGCRLHSGGPWRGAGRSGAACCGVGFAFSRQLHCLMLRRDRDYNASRRLYGSRTATYLMTAARIVVAAKRNALAVLGGKLAGPLSPLT